MTDMQILSVLTGSLIGMLLGIALAFLVSWHWDHRAASRSQQRRREFWRDMHGTTPPLPGESFDEWARRNDR